MAEFFEDEKTHHEDSSYHFNFPSLNGLPLFQIKFMQIISTNTRSWWCHFIFRRKQIKIYSHNHKISNFLSSKRFNNTIANIQICVCPSPIIHIHGGVIKRFVSLSFYFFDVCFPFEKRDGRIKLEKRKRVRGERKTFGASLLFTILIKTREERERQNVKNERENQKENHFVIIYALCYFENTLIDGEEGMI